MLETDGKAAKLNTCHPDEDGALWRNARKNTGCVQSDGLPHLWEAPGAAGRSAGGGGGEVGSRKAEEEVPRFKATSRDNEFMLENNSVPNEPPREEKRQVVVQHNVVPLLGVRLLEGWKSSEGTLQGGRLVI
ncbi:hypothetical protein EYF80_055883 [Liparis tanakae]|uniref:Uncharacterized protein n=1 Tax=Liparis tanakae TaxID=230148 RepID=A0A4Z2EZJ8_9TELE|nr:hypothetical protein EYF80_055883 [Liparis tanakae]